MKYLSLSFEEDLDRHDIERFKAVAGCTGVSAYKNTINLYFRHLSRQGLFSLALVLQERLAAQHAGVILTNTSLAREASAQSIYAALRTEAEI